MLLKISRNISYIDSAQFDNNTVDIDAPKPAHITAYIDSTQPARNTADTEASDLT
jgi:hypothetical protein